MTDLWGWTDAVTGREFVLVTHEAGTAFVEITDPVHPRVLGLLPVPSGAQRSRYHAVRVYKDHAFIVSDNAGPHGVQVFDLTQLRTVRVAPAVFRETARYARVESVHTLAIDTARGFAYAMGSNGGSETCGGGLHMIDVRTPTRPVFAGCYAETFGGSRFASLAPELRAQLGAGYGPIHDAECVVYHGPDRRYRGRQICVTAAMSGVGIVDVTDKRHPQSLGVARYPSVAFAHQGAFTADQRYFLLGDELDELHGPKGGKTRTLVFDMRELDDPLLVREFFGTTEATDHNLFVRGRYMYQSNNLAGLRVLDIGDPMNPKEVGYFDPSPGEDNTAALAGSWSNYPYFPSGLIALSNNRSKVGNGLFILRHVPPPP